MSNIAGRRLTVTWKAGKHRLFCGHSHRSVMRANQCLARVLRRWGAAANLLEILPSRNLEAETWIGRDYNDTGRRR